MKKLRILIVMLVIIAFTACDGINLNSEPVSSSGVGRKATTVKTESNGFTLEQNQIDARYQNDNKPGSIKHLYVISAYSGQTIIYSTVKGKVTSSSKRLTPSTVLASDPYQGNT